MSMKNLTGHFSTRVTPQTSPIPGREADMTANSAGGFSFKVDKWICLDRFLVLGTEGGSYYASEQTITKENATGVLECIKEDGVRVVNRIVEISDAGRAPKNTPAIFALAMCAKLGDDVTRKAAYVAMPKVCRIGTHLFQFCEAIEAFGGWGRGMRRAVAAWYTDQVNHDALENVGMTNISDEDQAAAIDRIHKAAFRRTALQVVKYQSRNGWSHRDVLRLAKPRGHGRDNEIDHILGWAANKWSPDLNSEPTLDGTELIWAHEKAKALGVEGVSKSGTASLVRLISDFRLPRECIPTQYLNEIAVWEALLDNGGHGMPMTAMIRNLSKMTAIDLIKPMSDAVGQVITALGNRDALRKARVHPLQLLVALNTYQSGRGVRGSLTWSPVAQVVDALDKAFYLAFEAIETTNKRYLLALDISGSMGSPNIAGMPGISPRIGSAAMALITAAVEPQHHIVGFTCQHGGYYNHSRGVTLQNFWNAPAGSKCNMFSGRGSGLSELTISPRQRLDDVVKYVSGLPMGGTDCAAPMLYAIDRNLEVDVFVVYTDSETFAGSITPSQALHEYRRKSGINAKLIVVGMVANEFSISDPDDAGMLDVIGFDTAAPRLMAEFAMGRI